MKEGRKPEYLEKNPGDELQKMPHTTAWRFKPQVRLELAQWQARKADMLTIIPHVAPNVTTLMAGFKNDHKCKNLAQNSEPHRSSWGTQKKKASRDEQQSWP